MCIRDSVRAIQKGYRNVYDPYVKLYHFESKSRDSYIPPVDFEMSDKMYQVYREKGDPYFNRQLDSYSCVPRMAEKESRDVVQVEKKEGILEKLKRKYRQMSRNTEPVTQEKEQPVDTPVSYTHLDVYKRQEYGSEQKSGDKAPGRRGDQRGERCPYNRSF